MTLNRTLTLDINPDAKLQTVRVKQDDADSNVFTISFVNSLTGADVSIPSQHTAKFRCIKPSGAGCIYPCTVNQNGTVTLTLSAASTDEHGLALADISIEKDGVILSTAAFWLDVKRSGVSDNISSSNEYVEMEETIALAQELIRQLQGGAIIECEDDGDGNVTIKFTAIDPPNNS